ncbi:MAG: formate C-acetyltransferase [Coriobacteriia bacterium]|nr:formate C-acetyltransferase [Coriobacteriia bacterium]
MSTTVKSACELEPAWTGFEPGRWCESVDVRDFIQHNHSPYDGDDAFLEGPTERTARLWERIEELMREESRRGILDADTDVVSSITSHPPGYVDREAELVVGLQTDEPLKRALLPQGGIRMVDGALKAYGYPLSPRIKRIFGIRGYRKTHNDGVFDCYTEEMRKARRSGIVTGLPDVYGRGRIIGDYRRVALYGVDRLLADKRAQHAAMAEREMTDETIRLTEELAEQYRALEDLKTMAASYGFDISRPAAGAFEAVQWLYFGYLGAVKEQNGAAMSLGRTSTFLDVYLERDLRDRKLTESEAQELVDQFVMKLRMVRYLRTPEYNELFSGDPTWVTEAIGGVGEDERHLVTKTSFRFLQTLRNLGPAPEPNLTVLWSLALPAAFKAFCARVSVETSAVQYENDDVMREIYGDDYGIACCVSAMRVGKQMQYFGARVNLAKALLYAINGGRDELSGAQVAPPSEPFTADVLDYDEVMSRYSPMLDWLARTYVGALNIIHYMHDKYSYERLEMALHDRDVQRFLACGVAGMSVAADSLSAIKHAKVSVVRDEETGLAVDYAVEGDFPTFGNNDERVDSIARSLVREFMTRIRKQKTYRDAIPTQSILTITSNVVYGKLTGSTPDGRKAGEPFAPGANPMHGRDISGPVASMCSVASLPYEYAQDGISYTFSIVPASLGRTEDERVSKLVGMLDGYFGQGGHHINVNVLDRSTLLDAIDHPEKYPNLTVRVSGYAVKFSRLTREQQLEVVDRTFHGLDDVEKVAVVGACVE